MARGIPLRDDVNVDRLRAVARSAGDAKQARRLLALSLIYDGGSRSEAPRHANVSLQTVRDWVLRFNAKGADGLVDGKSTGTPPRLNAAQRTALARVVEDGPTPYLQGVVRWRLSDLVAWVQGEFSISLDQSTLSRTLRAMGYRKLSARPRHHAQDPEAVVAFKKFPARVAEIRDRLAPGTAMEIWWQDEARIGQKNKITRRWAKRGGCPGRC